MRWRADFSSAGLGRDHPTSIVVSPDSSEVFVTGDSPRATLGEDYNTVAYNGWETAQPNNEGPYAIDHVDGKWGDKTGAELYWYACEK